MPPNSSLRRCGIRQTDSIQLRSAGQSLSRITPSPITTQIQHCLEFFPHGAYKTNDPANDRLGVLNIESGQRGAWGYIGTWRKANFCGGYTAPWPSRPSGQEGRAVLTSVFNWLGMGGRRLRRVRCPVGMRSRPWGHWRLCLC